MQKKTKASGIIRPLKWNGHRKTCVARGSTRADWNMNEKWPTLPDSAIAKEVDHYYMEGANTAPGLGYEYLYYRHRVLIRQLKLNGSGQKIILASLHALVL